MFFGFLKEIEKEKNIIIIIDRIMEKNKIFSLDRRCLCSIFFYNWIFFIRVFNIPEVIRSCEIP